MVDYGWFTDPDGKPFRVLYRTRCEPCDEEAESHDLDTIIDWQRGHRHIEMTYRTEYEDDVRSLPREVPSERLDRG